MARSRALADLLFDDEAWAILYLAVEAARRSPAAAAAGASAGALAANRRRVLVGSAAVSDIDCGGQGVRLGLARREVAARSTAMTAAPRAARAIMPTRGSMRELLGYRIIGPDGELGRVADFLINASIWMFQYFVIAPPAGSAAPQTIISPGWVNSLAPCVRAVHVNVRRGQLAHDPAFDLAHWQSEDRARP